MLRWGMLPSQALTIAGACLQAQSCVARRVRWQRRSGLFMPRSEILAKAPERSPRGTWSNCAASAREMARIVHDHAPERRDADAGSGSTDEIEEHARESVRMSLLPIGNPAWDTIRGVRFSMRYGPTLVAVLVTHAALEDIGRAAAGAGGHLASFKKHRDAVEQAASAKHQRGELEEDGAVVVQLGDLRSLGP
jgi:hypothetical protein